jgi:hypothetical protein
MAVTWYHYQGSMNDDGFYHAGIILPSGAIAWGGWAEYVSSGGYNSSHYSSCTPTNPYGHSSQGLLPLLGSYPEISGSDTWIRFMWGFMGAAPIKAEHVVRSHIWVVT